MSKEAYELAAVLNRGRGGSGVELAAVVAVEPLTIQIGDAKYCRDNWVFYEPVFGCKKIEAREGVVTGASVNCSQGGISQLSYAKDTAKELDAEMRYKVGDLLAVQQMSGDKQFLILSKVRRI